MAAPADEGMWLPNDPPRQLLKNKYGFDLTDAWLTKATRASVRFTNGGSGGFVSPDGLVATNHHIGADAIQKLSTREKNLYRDGFYAKTRAEELKCPDLELNVLQSITDVTERVNAAVKPDLDPAAAAAARRAILSQIEKESLDKTGLRSDVVTLYQGGLYHLYTYKKYTDVRLVFAPEHAIAFFGGDADNFEYPRYDLDVAFFRVYENGSPAKVEHYFKWSEAGPAEGDLVFVTGHPGTTNRLETLAKLIHRRDHTLPYTLARLRAVEAALDQYAERGSEPRRQSATDKHRVANARKAYAGQYDGLLNPQTLERKRSEEEKLTIQLGLAGPNQPLKPEDKRILPWHQVAEIQDKFAAFEKEYLLLEAGHAFSGEPAGLARSNELFAVARHLVRLADELPKPSAERLREYRDSNLDSLKLALFSPAPVYPGLERVKLAAALSFLAETFGGKNKTVELVLAGKSSAARADELVGGTKLADVAERKRLFDGGKAAVDASRDPMILLAKAVDAEARAVRKRFEETVEEPERQAFAAIAQARFRVLGRTVAPDATFTLRLAFGVVKGYTADGEKLPFHTTFGGAFDLAEKQGNREPYELPARWLGAKADLDLATPFDFVSTADTIGGNSGSPVLNRAGELVGLNFDRNRFGLVRNFVYTDEQARHIAVHSRAVLEALRKVYRAPELVRELVGK
jgi:Peptidase S46